MNERGLSMEFVQVMHEAAEKTGFCISGIDKDTYGGTGGMVILRLIPKQNDEATRIDDAKNQLVPDGIVGR